MIARALGVALAGSIVLNAVTYWRLDRATDALHEHERIAAAALMDAERQARATEQQWADNARKAAQTYAQQTTRVRADADGARDELERLRDALGGGVPNAAEGAASAARTDDLARARVVVAECAATLQALAANLDDTEARLIGLQAYVRAISESASEPVKGAK